MDTKKCGNCDMPLGNDGGCYNPYCNNPQAPVIESAWQPIETAPKDGTMILIGCSDTDEMVATSTAGRWIDGEGDGIDYMGSDGGFCDVDFSLFHPARSFGAEKSRYEGLQPTHWMPLPAPPYGA